MKLDTILQAAINDMKSGREEPHCGNAATEWENEIEFMPGYTEPGYDEPEKGVLLANWNRFPSRLTDILEKLGYSIEWSDEWISCDHCQKAVRTSPDCYFWVPSYVIFNECEPVCKSCVLADFLDEYEEHLLNNHNRADTFGIDWEARGFRRFNQDHYENGFHPGQNDRPAEIVQHLPANVDYLFEISGQGQFDTQFDLWFRDKEATTDEN